MKRGPKPVLRDQTVATLATSQTPLAAADLGVSNAYLNNILLAQGFVRRAGTVNTPGVGRPRVTFRLTRKGAGLARRLANA